MLQWLGSLVGLVAPRDGNFRTDWEGAGTAGDLRIDILRLIQNPKDEITDYYARLLETDIDPYGQGKDESLGLRPRGACSAHQHGPFGSYED